jgi:hypothetical protein
MFVHLIYLLLGVYTGIFFVAVLSIVKVEKLMRRKGERKYVGRCRKCGKWDSNIVWSVGLNPGTCDCKEPDTLYSWEEIGDKNRKKK